ncbi:MAG: membrane protein insertion efficiency factor YidD [Candidatus Pacebacteria bacterium]|nr:membrane protein insertion efficiency factor YidD [Candidatus Paceibacterota bacterium]
MRKNIFQGLIKIYQQFVSPYLGGHCRFYPSCSEYTYQAIEKHGSARGLIKGIGRLLRCHPLNRGGIDCP